jgi:hypothetical protein
MERMESGVVFEPEDGAGGGAGSVATAGDDGANGGQQTPGGANVSGGDGDGQNLPGRAGGQTAGGASLTSETALPPEIAQQLGVKTLGELASGYASQRESAQVYRDYARILQAKANRTGSQADQAAATAAQQKAYRLAAYGFQSEQEFGGAYKTNPTETLATLIERIADARAQALFEKQVSPLQQTVQTQQEIERGRAVEAITQRATSLYESVVKADPRFGVVNGKAGPLAKAFGEFLQNEFCEPDGRGGFVMREDVEARMARDPKFNPYELARRWVLGEVAQAGQQRAAEQMELANGIAGAARPGTGAAAAPKATKNESPLEAVRRVNALEVAQGKPSMSEDEMQAMARALERGEI